MHIAKYCLGSRINQCPLVWWLAYAALCLFATPSDVLAESLVSLQTRAHVTQKFLLIVPEKPSAAVVLFPGGSGVIGLQLNNGIVVIGKRGNFLVRSRNEFARHGFMVSVMDAPSDRNEGKGMIGGFRASEDHASDIASVVNYLKQQADVPVWLVGTSRGTESAANAAIRAGQDIAGLVLTSTVTRSNKKGVHVLEMDLESIKIPVLVVSHEGDECKITPASDAEKLIKRMKNSPKTEAKIMSGGSLPESKPCKAKSPHGYLGIEKETVDAIAQFIRANPPTGKQVRENLLNGRDVRVAKERLKQGMDRSIHILTRQDIF